MATRTCYDDDGDVCDVTVVANSRPPCNRLVTSDDDVTALRCIQRTSSIIRDDLDVEKRTVGVFQSSPPSRRRPLPPSTWSSVYVVLLTLLFHAVAVSSQWIERPPSTLSARLGQNATLTCRVNYSTPSVMWFQVTPGDVRTLFIDTAQWDAPARYSVSRVDGGTTLVLTQLTTDDDSVFKCSVKTDASSPFDASAQLTVLVNPGKPVLSVNSTSNPLRYPVTFTCTSTGGNPAPNVTWYRDGIQLQASTSTVNISWTPAAVKYGSTSSSLSLRWNALTDQLANFTCGASIDAIPASLNVSDPVYAPRLTVGPYSPVLNVVENSPVNLTCAVDASPPVIPSSVGWFKDGVTLDFGPFLNRWMTSRDSGVYVCSATNFVQSNASITVNIQYGPRLSPVSIVESSAANFSGTLHVSEFSKLNVTCEVDANPPVDASTLRWFRNGSRIQTGKYLSILALSRRDSGEYWCQASNVLMPSGGENRPVNGTAVFQIDVMFPPGNASISVLPSVITVGSNVSLHCSVSDPGNPAVTFNWARYSDTTVFPSGNVLQLNNIALTNIGTYSCAPYNRVGDGQRASYLLNVIEPPSWLQPSLPTNMDIQVNQSSVQSFNCVSRGLPKPEIRWLKDGQPLDGTGWYSVSSNFDQIETYSFKVTSTLYLQGTLRTPTGTSLRPDDAGRYECVISSPNVTGVVNPQSQSLSLTVRYAPLMNLSSLKMAVDAGRPARLLCRARATPPPAFIWTNAVPSLPLTDNSQYQTATWVEAGEKFPYVSSLNITSVRMSDLGVYTCRAQNEMGMAAETFNVTVRTVPDAPYSLTLVTKTWESIQFTWTPGFDGGYPQNFVVLVSVFSTSSSAPLNISSDTTLIYNVTGLNPSTMYSLKVYARNQLGDSLPSQTFNVPTDSLTLNPPNQLQFTTKSHTLTFLKPANTDVCLRVRVLRSSSPTWSSYPSCLPVSSGSVELASDTKDADAMEAAFCIERRQDICSPVVNATMVTEDLPVVTIIVVVCVCGGVIIILTIILIVLCCLRCHRARKRREQLSDLPLQPIGSPVILNNHLGNSKLLTPEPNTYITFDNPSMDPIDLSDKMPAAVGYYYQTDPHTGSVMKIPLSPPPYTAHTSPLGGSNGSDSGVSTPDTPKPPRRVIREVVV